MEMILHSTLRFTADGTEQFKDLTFVVYEEDGIHVYFDGERVDQGWEVEYDTTPQRINFTETIPAGTDVLVRRATDMREIPHVFHYTGNVKGGAEFNSRNVDDNFDKIRRGVEDAMDSFELVGINVEAALDAKEASDQAKQYAIDAEQSYQNTLAYDQQGEQWMLAAQEAAIEAESSKDLAYRWANEPENQPVEQGEFSAYHWAKKAQEFVGGPYLLVSNNLAEGDREEARASLGLGSAATREVGTGADEVRTNNQNDSRFAQLSGGANADFTAMPEVGGSPIVESGYNANGAWIKWADGTMVCTFEGECTYQISSFLSKDATYPSQFVAGSHPIVVATPLYASQEDAGMYVDDRGPMVISATN